MFEYKGKPFANGLQAYVYRPDYDKEAVGERIYVLVGLALKNLKAQIEKKLVAAQFGYDLYCIPFDPADLPEEIPIKSHEFSFRFKFEGKKQLVTTDDNHREIIRRLIADAIARKQLENGWFVEPRGFAYHWSYTLSKKLQTALMEVYPGFVYRPYVYKDGSCAVMIDPKFKFMPRKNLRDVINELLQKGIKQETLKLLFEDEILIDSCPFTDCPYRKNPMSDCWLKGAGKRRRLITLDFSKNPSNASLDLIKYHRGKCKFYGKIADMIDDSPPVALVERAQSSVPLEYPVERLREELKLHKIPKPQRAIIMRYIQPLLDVRWKLTENFLSYVDDITIGRWHNLQLIRAFAKLGSNKQAYNNFKIFQEPPLMFGNKACSHDPFMGLEKNGPYDLYGEDRRKFNSLRIFMLNLSRKLTLEDIKRFYNDLVNGFTRGGAHFAGLKKIFKLEIPNFSEDLLFSDTKEIEEIDMLSSSQHPIILLILCHLISDHKIREYGSLKRKLTMKGMLSQFILEKRLSFQVTPHKYASYLKNVALNLYYKVGGIPWVIARTASFRKCFIGLATIIRKDTLCSSFQIFDSSGFWFGGWTEFVDKNEYSDWLVKSLRKAQEIYLKERGKIPNRIILHKDGEMLNNAEIKPIIEEFKNEVTCVSVKKTFLPRLYDDSRSDYVVKRGTCVQIDDNIAILATSGPPQKISGSQRPITVEVKGGALDYNGLMGICEDIFDLSLVYGGYRLAIVSKPVTTHFAGKAVRLASKHGIKVSPALWRKAWFI